MRYLNKIVFINSANISYAEINVDGNVHFTGTQGVGKSTVLRALLFFYNADKQKLGIQSGQKPFDEFYFKQTNSYILYEVMRENGAYTILVSRYQGRASFRFIDAPYNKEWLIDESNRVLSDWTKINDRIDKHIPRTARIDSGAMYRDIIFGNTHNYKFAKYAIVESSRYQNIPRSIQNVFLNSKLDADFVKNTIIQSMADEDIPLDLTTYRRQVLDFEREYEEIDCWFRQDKDGAFPVRRLAGHIAERGRQIVAFDQQVIELWHQLNYAVAQSEEKIPIIESRISSLREKQNEEETKIQDLTEVFNKDKDKINQEIGAQKEKLSQISAKRKYFESIGIKDKLSLADKEPSLKQELQEKQNVLNDLLKTSTSIEEKYLIARGKLENAQHAFEISQEEILNRKRNEVQQKRDRFVMQYDQSKTKLIDAYDQWRSESDERLQELTADQHRQDCSLRELRTWHPKQEERKAIECDIQQIQVDEKELVALQTAKTSQIEQLRQEGMLQQNEIVAEFDNRLNELDTQLADANKQKNQAEEVLARLDGSLYDWLTKNIDGWEETIGKVVDEEKILYSQNLQPKVDSSAQGLYGISLNLDAIESSHRTPDEYRAIIVSFEEELDNLRKQKFNLMEEKNKAVEKLSKHYAEKINPLRQELTTLRVQISQLPAKRQDLENRLHQIKIEEEELIQQEHDVRQKSYNDALLKLQAEKDNRESRQAKHKKELSDLNAKLNKSLNPLAEQLDQCKIEIANETLKRQTEFRQQLKQLQVQQKAELEGKGVDVALVGQYRDIIKELQQSLQMIDDNRQDVSEYRGAERDLFSLEPMARKEVKLLDAKLLQQRQRFSDRRSRIDARLKEIKEKISGQMTEIAVRKDGIDQYRRMTEVEHLVPASFIGDTNRKTTPKSCQELISLLRGADRQKRETMESLRQNVVTFNRHFKPQNAFNFNTTPITDADYMAIATDLQDFLDNNKIEEYRRRTSDHYKDILQRIAVEVGALMKRRSEVDQVIGEINRDFVEKNFTGVIRSIALRSDDSSDRLMRLLSSIQHYAEENSHDVGEMNLFSTENHQEVGRKAIDYLWQLTKQLQAEPSRTELTLCHTFRLQFRVVENDNDTGWVERINNVGSDGTDILVKAMVNIMLINVFKKRASRKGNDYIVHCMMDEIGRLHPTNIRGILQFANSRNIYLINSSPTSYNAYDYRYTYLLAKKNLKTIVEKLIVKK